MSTHPLRQWLTQRGWTQRQLATLLGVSDSLVSRWLRGHRSPSAEQLAKIEKIDRGLAARLRSPTE